MKIKMNKLKNSLGKTRVVKKFLFLPKILDDELIWLEKVKIIQQVCEINIGSNTEYEKYKYRWRDMKWKN